MNSAERLVSTAVRLLDNDRIEFRSRVKFRALPQSRDLHDALLRNGTKHVYPEHASSGHHLECWPVDEEFLVLEISDTGPRADATHLKWAHGLNAEAQVDVLYDLDGYAELVARRDFDATEHPVVRGKARQKPT
jgi:hypothetical protein